MTFGNAATRHGLSLIVFLKWIDYSDAKSLLACDTTNEHALERHAAAVRQLSNGDDLYILIATLGNTIQTVNFPMYEYIHEYSW